MATHDPRAASGVPHALPLVVQLEGLPFDFAFAPSDITELLMRYGPLKTMQLLDSALAPDVVLVEFQSSSDATACVQHLDGMAVNLEGHQCVLRVSEFGPETDRILQKKLEIAAATSLAEGPAGPQPIAASSRWSCRFVIGAEIMHRDFPVVGRIIGPQGEHMKNIHEVTGAKLRLRGKRSNFREGTDNRESDDPLHLCVTAADDLNYQRACEMVERLMGGVYQDYSNWCAQRMIPVPQIQLLCVEGAFTENLESKLCEFYGAAGYQGGW